MTEKENNLNDNNMNEKDITLTSQEENTNKDFQEPEIAIDSEGVNIESAENSLDKSTKSIAISKPLELLDSKRKSRKRRLLTVLAFILFNIIAVGVVILMEGSGGEISFVDGETLLSILKANVIFVLFAFLCYMIGMLSNAVAFFALIKQCGYGPRFWVALKTVFIGRYYDNITPWNTGGQPFQIAYLTQYNIDFPTACTLPIIKYAIRVFFINGFTLILFIVIPLEVSTIVKVGAYLGLFITPSLPVLLIIFSGKVPFMLKVTEKIVGVLHKLKIIRNYEKALAKAQDTVDSFLAAFKYLGQHKSMILIIGLVSLVDYVAVGAIPYFIIRAFGGDVNFLDILTLSSFATMSAGIVPTPGSSGAAEGSFYSAFAQVVPNGFLMWAVLFWRMFVFYIHIVMGIVILFYDWIKGKTKIALVKKELAWGHRKTINLFNRRAQTEDKEREKQEKNS
jgi:uncharacterized protein (TIRG00374 family)